MTLLVLRALGIGDLATAVPALRGLRAARPTEELVLAAPAWLAPLARLTGAVDRLLAVDGLTGRIPPIRPGLAVNLHGKGPESHRLLAGTGPGRLLAFAAPGFPDGPPWDAAEHEVLRWCRMLAWYGIVAVPADLLLHRPAVPPVVDGATIVHPGAKDPARRWPAARYAEVARYLHRHGHHVVVTGAPAETGLATRIAHLAGLPSERVLAGRTDVGGLASLVSRARLVVCGDTGIAHLATGYRTPSVSLFGPTPPRLWGPVIDPDRHTVLWHGPVRRSGRPGPHPALAAIAVDEVLAAVADLERLYAAAP